MRFTSLSLFSLFLSLSLSLSLLSLSRGRQKGGQLFCRLLHFLDKGTPPFSELSTPHAFAASHRQSAEAEGISRRFFRFERRPPGPLACPSYVAATPRQPAASYAYAAPGFAACHSPPLPATLAPLAAAFQSYAEDAFQSFHYAAGAGRIALPPEGYFYDSFRLRSPDAFSLS